MSFVPNSRGIGEVAKSREVKEALRDRADAVADEARRLADAEAYDTGEFANSIGVEEEERADRAVAYVISDDDKAPYLEWGTVDTPRFRILGRAANIRE